MMLPIFVFIPNAFYYGFNEYATAQIHTEYENYRATNIVNSVNDLIEGNYYTYNNNFSYINNTNEAIIFFNFYFFDNSLVNDYQNGSVANLHILANSSQLRVFYKNTNGVNSYVNISSQTFNFLLIAKFANTALVSSHINLYENNDLIVDEYSMSISDSMAFAFDSTMRNSIFVWATSTFLNQPFEYISGLFGIAANNPINTLLSYWLSISIIWLVFDLIMYVPLLVHRWIDKGGID